jgi:hypothetical protein
MATLRIKRRKNATETIDTGIETQAKDRITVNRNTRYQERRQENETHQIDTDHESNNGQDS